MKLWFKKQEETPDTESGSAVLENQAAPSPVPGPATRDAGVSIPANLPPANPVSLENRDTSSVPVRPKKNQKALYYQLMNALYDAVLILDDNGHVVDCNERVPSVLGHTREELWDVHISTIIPGITSQIFAKMKTGLHGNHRVLLNARCHRKDGTSFSGEIGAGLIDLTGENLVLTIRNIEKRSPVKAIVRKTP